MILAFWCIFILIFLPLLVTGYGKYKAGYTKEDNRSVREFYANKTGVIARANAAQLNCYEIFPPFAAAVLIAFFTGNADTLTINLWALTFTVTRIAFCWAYITDRSSLRSSLFVVNLVCIVALFIAAI